jgi:hypothetical protein
MLLCYLFARDESFSAIITHVGCGCFCVFLCGFNFDFCLGALIGSVEEDNRLGIVELVFIKQGFTLCLKLL